MTKQELITEIKTKKSFLCIGLDTDLTKIPECVKTKSNDPIFEFNKAIIDATHELCIAYKPNLAFYETLGTEGILAFEKTVSYLKTNYPKHLIIADAKRGDIGNTSEAYARCFFEQMAVDALTVSPYMGEDSIKPMLSYKDKWTIVLALTSNKGSVDFQMLKTTDDKYLFEEVLEKTSQWGTDEQLMYVVGATKAQMLEKIRDIVPNHFLLVPGIGAQNGSLEDVAHYGMTKDCGLIVNVSRGIIYASNGDDFIEKAVLSAKQYQKKMEELLVGFYNNQ